MDERGEKFFQIGIWMSPNAGILTKRPTCALWPVTCSLMYSKRPPTVIVARFSVITSWP